MFKEQLLIESNASFPNDNSQLSNVEALNLSHIQTPLKQTTFEKIVTKEEIAHGEQFLLLSQCFPLLAKYVQSRLLQICFMWERVKCCVFEGECYPVFRTISQQTRSAYPYRYQVYVTLLPHFINLQQTNLINYWQNNK